jgi:hypothetical protein
MSSNEFDIPEEINVHRQIWAKMQLKLFMAEER